MRQKYFSFGVNSNLYGRPMSPQLFEGYAHKMLWIHGLSWNTLNTVLLCRMLQCKDDTTYLMCHHSSIDFLHLPKFQGSQNMQL